MTRYLLDTNIVSNATKTAPSVSLPAWMSEQVDEDLFIASLTIAEIRRDESNDCTIVTANAKHFPGIETLNPMREEQDRE